MALKNAGDLPRANDMLQCARKLKDLSSGALGWIGYAEFVLRLESDISDALTHVHSVIESDISLGAKTYATAASCETLKAQQRFRELDDLLISLDRQCRLHLGRGANPDDINFNSNRIIGHHADASDNQAITLLRTFANDGEFEIIHEFPGNSLPLNSPALSNMIPPQIRHAVSTQRQPTGISVRLYRNVSVAKLGQTVFFFDQSDNVLTLFGPITRVLDAAARDFLQRNRHRMVTVPGITLSIMDEFTARNYCHWMLDWLPRILITRNSLQPNTNILGINALSLPFERDSLARLIDTTRYLSLDQMELIFVEQLVCVDNVGHNLFHPLYNCNRELRTRLSELIFDHDRGSSDYRARRLYIPRQHNRRVLNEEALLALLRTHGFETIDTDRMTISEQATAFREASMVIAPHGAALTNLIYSKPTTKVLELFPRFGGSPAFYKMSNSFNLEYSCYVDDVTNPAYHALASGNSLVNDSSFIVDTNFIKEWLT